jgi:hypothetical protein
MAAPYGLTVWDFVVAAELGQNPADPNFYGVTMSAARQVRMDTDYGANTDAWTPGPTLSFQIRNGGGATVAGNDAAKRLRAQYTNVTQGTGPASPDTQPPKNVPSGTPGNP